MSRGTINKVILIGRLGAEPEVRYAPSGNPVANFSVATNRSYKDKDGNMVEETEWHRITAWMRLAEFAKQYLHKGMRVYVEGRLHYRQWQDQNGIQRTTTDIIANEIQMLETLGNRVESPEEASPDTDIEIPNNYDQAQDENLPF